MTPDPLALNAARRVLSALLLGWPLVVEVRGEDGADVRLRRAVARVAELGG
jgi:hypothetical protein